MNLQILFHLFLKGETSVLKIAKHEKRERAEQTQNQCRRKYRKLVPAS